MLLWQFFRPCGPHLPATDFKAAVSSSPSGSGSSVAPSPLTPLQSAPTCAVFQPAARGD